MNKLYLLAALNLQWLGLNGGKISFQKTSSNEAQTLSFETKSKKAEWINWVEHKNSAYVIYRNDLCPIMDCQDPKPLLSVRKVHPQLSSEHTLPYPGKISDPENGQLLFRSRAFYGECLQDSTAPSLVSFQEERVDRRRNLQSSVAVLSMGEEQIKDFFYDKKLPKLAFTLKQLKSKKCVEIEPLSRTTLRKKIDLSPSKASEEEVQVKDSAGETVESSAEKTTHETPKKTENKIPTP